MCFYISVGSGESGVGSEECSSLVLAAADGGHLIVVDEAAVGGNLPQVRVARERHICSVSLQT